MSLDNPISNFKLSTKEKLERAFAAFSRKERAVFFVLALGLVAGALGILQGINKTLMVEVPFEGGEISEGIVGTPRFVNPVLASSPADQDMAALVYSGLMRKNGAAGPIPDLAESYEASKDGLSYTFTLKEDIYFHDGEPVTADDVIFTIDRVKNSVIVSPQKVNWEGVSVEKVDDKTLKFSLRQPNPNFLENAALGILPKALWEDESMELNPRNTEPVGSGPFKIESVSKESSGVVSAYELSAFERFALDEPYIQKINFRFYPNEEEMVRAFEDGTVGQISSLTPAVAAELEEKGSQVNSAVLPRVFGLFFNQNQNQVFLDKAVIRAIHDAIDKEKIVRDVLLGYGIAIDSPLPPNLAAEKADADTAASREEIIEAVKASLDKNGWKESENGVREKKTTVNKKSTTLALAFSISTGNAPELVKTAELIKQDLEKVGMRIEIKTFEAGNLNQNVIRPREYDALLFGQIVNRESDLFAFWHSSQRKDPGLNVALYTNAQADKLLEDAFVVVDPAARAKKYRELESEIKKDMPAVFLYSPDFIYVTQNDLRGLNIERLSNPADRFAKVHEWFTNTQDVWKIFSKI